MIEIEIEELILRGFRPEERETIAEGMKSELLLSLKDYERFENQAGGREIRVLNAGDVHVEIAHSGKEIGQKLASTVHKGLGPLLGA